MIDLLNQHMKIFAQFINQSVNISPNVEVLSSNIWWITYVRTCVKILSAFPYSLPQFILPNHVKRNSSGITRIYE